MQIAKYQLTVRYITPAFPPSGTDQDSTYERISLFYKPYLTKRKDF